MSADLPERPAPVALRIPGYALDRRLGRGGMATVYLAHDERLGRRVALKVLAPELAADAEFRQRFLRETRAAAAVDHPHIVPVYDAGEASGVLYLAMRYASGGDVHSLIDAGGPLHPARAAAILSPVAAALDAAHRHGLVHRDVKPANMLMDGEPGVPEHVYLSDFGLAKASASTALTGTGQFVGTLTYCAPEQISDQLVDGRADQYSLACTACELLTGRPPFERERMAALIWAHMSEQPPPVSALRPGLPWAVDAVIARALSKAPGQRYPSCGEFAEALRAALGLPPYHAAQPPLVPAPYPATVLAGAAGLARPASAAPAPPAPAPAAYASPVTPVRAPAPPPPTPPWQQEGNPSTPPWQPPGAPPPWQGSAPPWQGPPTTSGPMDGRRRLTVLATVGAVLVLLVGGGIIIGLLHGQGQGSDGTPGTWRTALALQNVQGPGGKDDYRNTSISCPSAGNCGADEVTPSHAFVLSETHGTWSMPTEVRLASGATDVGWEESCAAPGRCSAGGSYLVGGTTRVFVTDEVNGSWGAPQPVPGLAALENGGTDGDIDVISCPAPGQCSAGGYYEDANFNDHLFVVDEVNGSWGTAYTMPGTDGLTKGGDGSFDILLALSCAAPGACSAGGIYTDAAGNQQAFVADEVSGTWADAQEVPGTAALNAGGDAGLNVVSCAAPGTCSAGGTYQDTAGHNHAFVSDETNGTWADAQEVPGVAALDTGGDAAVSALSCAAPGTCSAGGSYKDAAGHYDAFVVAEVSGTWGTAKELAGTPALNVGGDAEISALSCAGPSTCSAGGSYKDADGHTQVFVADELHGTWSAAQPVAGVAALNTGGDAEVYALSCAPPGDCGAGGWYKDSSGDYRPFVVSKM